MKQLLIGQAQHLLHEIHGQGGLPRGEKAIEHAEGIAHGAIAEAGDLVDYFVIGLHLLLLEDHFEMSRDIAHGDGAEIESLTAALDGGGNFLSFCGTEDELHMGGRFLHCFQEGIEGRGGKHVDFIDDIYFVLTAGGRQPGSRDEIAGIVDAPVGSPVDFDDIQIIAAENGVGNGFLLGQRIRYIEGFGENAGHRGFSHASGAGEEIGVGDAVVGDGVFEGSGHGLLADDFIEVSGAESSGKNGVTHGDDFQSGECESLDEEGQGIEEQGNFGGPGGRPGGRWLGRRRLWLLRSSPDQVHGPPAQRARPSSRPPRFPITGGTDLHRSRDRPCGTLPRS